MKTFTLLFVFLILAFTPIYSQGIFDAAIHTAVPFGDVDSPGAESSQEVIDQDPMTKFLDFDELDGIGFEVDLLGVAAMATSISVITANDAPERDPMDYEIFGSTDGTDYTSIATGSIPCVTERFLSRTFGFTNETAYTFYRINFTGTCNTSSILQIADVQLYPTIGNAPTIDCPADIVVNTSPGQCTGMATFTVTANDVEDGMLTTEQILGIPSGGDFPIGSSPVVMSVMDSDNNSISCSFNVIVEDMEAPTFECPEDMVVFVGVGETETEVNYMVVDADNCSNINAKEAFTSLGTIDGKSYYLSDSTFSITDAIFDAFDQEGFVGTIRSEADNAYILDAIKRSGYLGQILIGYSDQNSEGNFEWFSGDPTLYFNWAEDEPNNSGAAGEPENYTIMQTSGLWNDVAPVEGIVYRYLLEIDYQLNQIEGSASGESFPLGTTTNTFVATDLAGNTTSCSFDITLEVNTSVKDLSLENGITLSPNPTTDAITIGNKYAMPLQTISVYDFSGKLVCTVNSTGDNQTIDVAVLAPGLYLVKIKGEQGILTKKIVKQ